MLCVPVHPFPIPPSVTPHRETEIDYGGSLDIKEIGRSYKSDVGLLSC